jgi:ATP-dependent DNA helicase RecG
VYGIVRRELELNRQAYIIYPLVEGSERVDLRAATEMAEHLQAEVFPEYKVALLHGRLKGDEKDRVMAAFARGDVHVLVATTVVEVGVDVPNATVMVIEHAERFGLSQLHQLRGRVGRGSGPSTCVLLYQYPISDAGRARLDALVETSDGFVIAERDLEQRGPGRFLRDEAVRPSHAACRRLAARSLGDGGRPPRGRRVAGRTGRGRIHRHLSLETLG